MHRIEKQILLVFRKNPSRDYSTGELVREIFTEEVSKINEELNNDFDKSLVKKGKERKGGIHRKTLYHLNKLVKNNIIRVNRVVGKGEKCFCLSIDTGEITISDKNSKITINKSDINTDRIKDYEKKGVVVKYDSRNWLNKINCNLIIGRRVIGASRLYLLITNILNENNDAIGISDFEEIINNNYLDNLIEIIRKMIADSKDFDKNFSLIIDLEKLKNKSNLLEIIKLVLINDARKINFVFLAKGKDLINKKVTFSSIIKLFEKHKFKLNVQNKSLKLAPLIVGKTGIYGLREDEWEKINSFENNTCVNLASNTIAVDLKKFFDEESNPSKFRELLINISKTLLEINSSKRKNVYNDQDETFCNNDFVKNYIRFWNYNLSSNSQENFIDLLKSAKKNVKKFCETENTIYKACGIPINFNIDFSSAFNKLSDNFSLRDYEKSNILDFKDLQSEEEEKRILDKEKIFSLFGKIDRFRLFRKGDVNPRDVIRELCYLINTYNLSLITYDFREVKNKKTLKDFFD